MEKGSQTFCAIRYKKHQQPLALLTRLKYNIDRIMFWHFEHTCFMASLLMLRIATLPSSLMADTILLISARRSCDRVCH